MQRLRGLVLSGFLMPAAAAAAQQPPCAPRDEVARILRGGYGEVRVSTGLHADGRLVEVFASPATGTWTLVATDPQGLACLVKTGRHWGNGSGADDRASMAGAGPTASGR